MPVRTAGALVFLLLMIEQHNTFSFWNGYQINPKICQNILYSHCFMSQNTCFSFLNSGTVDSYFSVLNLLFMENYHLSIHMAFWKESMINRLSNLINRNRSAAKISQVLCSSSHVSLEVTSLFAGILALCATERFFS